jgi:hypothetical protein
VTDKVEVLVCTPDVELDEDSVFIWVEVVVVRAGGDVEAVDVWLGIDVLVIEDEVELVKVTVDAAGVVVMVDVGLVDAVVVGSELEKGDVVNAVGVDVATVAVGVVVAVMVV